MCLIFENQDSTNQETYQAMTVSLCLMTEEDQHGRKLIDYPPEIALKIRLIPSEGKTIAFDFPIHKLKSDPDCKGCSGTKEVFKKNTTQLKGPLVTGHVDLITLCQYCHADSPFNFSLTASPYVCTHCERSSAKK